MEAKALAQRPSGGVVAVRTGTPQTAKMFNLGYRPSLDGLRGIAISMVVGCHLALLSGTFGFIGVDLFFVLSGFLITCLLVQEWQQAKTLSLAAFYARRALRLLPALVVLLAVYVSYAALAYSPKELLLDVKHALTTLFYFMNWALVFYPENIVHLRHAWSLSIEEQFYLLWPCGLLLLLRRTDPMSMLCYVLLGAFCSWGIRSLLFLGTAASSLRLFAGLDTRADSLLLGCALAVLLGYDLWPRSVRVTLGLHYGAALAVVGIVIIGCTCEVSSPGMHCLGWFLVSLFAALIILQLMVAPQSWLNRVLAHPALVYLGKISYGLYLWHWPALKLMEEVDCEWTLCQRQAVGMGIAILATLGSYYLVEQPCLRIRKRFQKVG